jgi:sarcosine oxidase subunit beta
MISGGWHGRWNEQGHPETLPDQVAGNFAEAVAVYPILATSAVAEADASRTETISIDGIPIIGRLPGADNMLVATGWSGHGWAIAPAVVQLLAQWALSGTQPELFRPFAYDRFWQ